MVHAAVTIASSVLGMSLYWCQSYLYVQVAQMYDCECEELFLK